MSGILLGLGAAVAYGLSDFAGGVASRRVSAWAVAVMGQFAAAVVVGVALAFVAGDPRPIDLLWGVVAGIGNGIGTGFLYRGFGSGRLAVVGPISAVASAIVPVGVGLLTGERPGPLVWVGILAALPGIWLVSRAADEPPPGGRPVALGSSVRDGVLAGLGFGVVFAALGLVPESAGLLPVFVNQLVAVAAIVGLAVLTREQWRPRGLAVWGGTVAGVLGSSATLVYLAAVQAGSLTVAAVLTALYPAVTILLAALVLREHIRIAQGLGLLFCGAAVALVAAG